MKLGEDKKQIITDRIVVLCDATKSSKKKTQPIDHMILMDLVFMGIIKPCPYSEIKVFNISRAHFSPSLPTGNYKTTMKIMDDSDDKVFEVLYYDVLKPQA